MTTHFIEAEIDLQANSHELHQEIEAKLKQEGSPLRWAITKVEREKQKVTVEAVVTKDS